MKIQRQLNSVRVFFHLIVVVALSCSCTDEEPGKEVRPNILILMSDNHSWNHLGCYGDPVVETPNIDGLAQKGIRFTNAYCSSPSCSPARASMLTGQNIWRLGEAANLWGGFPNDLQVYTDILEKSGYHVGFEGKGWGPGNYEESGWARNPAGNKFDSFEEFYNGMDSNKPFCYWYSSRDPHRPYNSAEWKNRDTRLHQIEVPPYLPDVPDVKKDIGDYYGEIENFDKDVGKFLESLERLGELDNTLVIVCSDNGWQMPRGLANLYDFGTRIPFILSMPSRYQGNRVVKDFVSLNDIAPTAIELAGQLIPEEITAKSLVNILESNKEGQIDKDRTFIVTARERHAFVRAGGAGYGGRAYRTNDYLYIRNYEYQNWPAGDPPLYGDVDAHMLQYPCATKMYILENKNRDDVKEYFNLGFAKRPQEELYDLKNDPFQLNNLAYSPSSLDVKNRISSKLSEYLKANGDPREIGGEMLWINAEYFSERDFYPKPSEEARKRLDLEKEYSYIKE